MKALVLTEYNHFEYRDVPEPKAGPDDVLIQVRACGICGTVWTAAPCGAFPR